MRRHIYNMIKLLFFAWALSETLIAADANAERWTLERGSIMYHLVDGRRRPVKM